MPQHETGTPTIRSLVTCTLCITLFATTLILLRPTAVTAQELRRDDLIEAKAEKAKSLHPYEPNKVEEAVRALTAGEKTPLYPWFGGQFPGAGFSLGVGTRRFLTDTVVAEAHAVWSSRNFKVFDASLIVPSPTAGRPRLLVRAGWRDAPALPFFGVGDASSSARFGGAINEWFAIADVDVHATSGPFVHAVSGMRLMHSDVESLLPFVERGFRSDLIPGFGTSPRYAIAGASAGIDTRTSPGYSSSGTLLSVSNLVHVDTGDEHGGFSQTDITAVQLIPLVRGHWVIALRGALSSADPFEDETVPWFMLPTLGGSTTLRAYPWGRFRDQSSGLASIEWRTFINRAVDLAFFYEAGIVAPDVDELRWRDAWPSYGVGIRFHGRSFTALRTELAHGREGLHLNFSFGPAF